MKKLNQTEKDLIEAIRNFRATEPRLENGDEFEWLIYYYLHKLMYEN